MESKERTTSKDRLTVERESLKQLVRFSTASALACIAVASKGRWGNCLDGCWRMVNPDLVGILGISCRRGRLLRESWHSQVRYLQVSS